MSDQFSKRLKEFVVTNLAIFSQFTLSDASAARNAIGMKPSNWQRAFIDRYWSGLERTNVPFLGWEHLTQT